MRNYAPSIKGLMLSKKIISLWLWWHLAMSTIPLCKVLPFLQFMLNLIFWANFILKLSSLFFDNDNGLLMLPLLLPLIICLYACLLADDSLGVIVEVSVLDYGTAGGLLLLWAAELTEVLAWLMEERLVAWLSLFMLNMELGMMFSLNCWLFKGITTFLSYLPS